MEKTSGGVPQLGDSQTIHLDVFYLDGEYVPDHGFEEECVVLPVLWVITDSTLGLPLLLPVRHAHLIHITGNQPRKPSQTCRYRENITGDSRGKGYIWMVTFHNLFSLKPNLKVFAKSLRYFSLSQSCNQIFIEAECTDKGLQDFLSLWLSEILQKDNLWLVFKKKTLSIAMVFWLHKFVPYFPTKYTKCAVPSIQQIDFFFANLTELGLGAETRCRGMFTRHLRLHTTRQGNVNFVYKK